MPIWAGGVSSSLSFCSQTYLFFAILFFIFHVSRVYRRTGGQCLIDYLDYRQHPSRDYATAYLDNCGRQVYKPPHPPPLYTLATGSQQYVLLCLATELLFFCSVTFHLVAWTSPVAQLYHKLSSSWLRFHIHLVSFQMLYH